MAIKVLPEVLSGDPASELAVPLANAISAAHERGVTHRDLNPGNVMVGGSN